MTARRGQVASLDLVLSFILLMVFIALVIVYIFTITTEEPVRYGEGLLDQITFVDDRVLDHGAMPSDDKAFGESLFEQSQYSENSSYCITLDSSSGREALLGTACVPSICDETRGLDRYAINVLNGTRINQLTLWVCT